MEARPTQSNRTGSRRRDRIRHHDRKIGYEDDDDLEVRVGKPSPLIGRSNPRTRE